MALWVRTRNCTGRRGCCEISESEVKTRRKVEPTYNDKIRSALTQCLLEKKGIQWTFATLLLQDFCL